MRKLDSGWRDNLLTVRHRHYGFELPAAGMGLPMIEYDHGEPLAVISYQKRGEQLPKGDGVSAAYTAFGRLSRSDGSTLPFLTVQYDPRNWSFRLFPHNRAAFDFTGHEGWWPVNELRFVSELYRLRGRPMPDLEPYGITYSTAPWLSQEPFRPAVDEPWPHAAMSVRRRNYEPVAHVRAGQRNPCLDVDFAVLDRDRRVSLLVDYKAPGARVSLKSTNLTALADLFVRPRAGGLVNVPAMVVRYEPTKPAWGFHVHCLNQTARMRLSYVLGASQAPAGTLAAAITGEDWVELTEAQWLDVLRCARDL